MILNELFAIFFCPDLLAIVIGRGTKEGAIIALLIAVYLAFQHFSRTGFQKAFDQGSVVATVGIFGITIASFLFLI